MMSSTPWTRVLALVLVLAASCEKKPSAPAVDATGDEGPGAAQILEAFFGLDDMPITANRLCPGSRGMDGMPVTFSRRIGVDTPDADAFRVTTRSGRALTPRCATLQPALGPSKRHTVLLVGELGDASDPPERVEVVGSVPLLGGGNARGLASPPVTPLVDGPSLRIAHRYAPESLPDSECPAETTEQIVQLTWAGGVTALSGGELGDAERTRMRVTLEGGAVVYPVALADLGDRDNYTHLCLAEPALARAVTVEPAVAVDPRGDPNPETTLAVTEDPEAIRSTQ